MNAYLNQDAVLSSAGFKNDLWSSYLHQSSTLKLKRNPIDPENERLLGWIQLKELDELSDPFESPLNLRTKKIIELLIEDLSQRTPEKKFDQVIFGRGGKGFNPNFIKLEAESYPSSSSLCEWVWDALNKYGFKVSGRSNVTCIETSCVTGVSLLATARKRIQLELANRILLINFDPLYLTKVFRLEALGVSSHSAPELGPRIFRSDRDGFTPSEAASAQVVSNKHELKDSPPLLIEATSITCDGGGLVSVDPTGDGLKRSIESTLGQAGIPLNQISLIKVHGTGTVMNDKTESMVLKNLNYESSNAPVIGFKSQFGHALNGNGLFELTLFAHCLRSNKVAAVKNLRPDDETLGLNLVKQELQQDFETGLGLSMGFGGINGSYLLRKPREH